MGRRSILRKAHGSQCFLGTTAGESKLSTYPEPECGLSHLRVWIVDHAGVPGVLGNAFTEIYHLGSTHLERDFEKRFRGSQRLNEVQLDFYCEPILFWASQEETGMNREESTPGVLTLT